MQFWITFLLFILLTSCSTTGYHGPVSDHFDGNKFYYYGEKERKRNFIMDLFSWAIVILQNPWPSQLPQIHNPYMTPSATEGIKVTFINHATVLIQTKNHNILTDPIYSERASPFQWIGPSRWRPPGVAFAELPNIDLVLISHNHYDHLDKNTVIALNERYHPLFIVPLGNKLLLNSYHIDNVIELDWWQPYKKEDITITFLPARHSTARSLFDLNKTLWGSYGIEVDHKKIYFGGDSGYGPHYKMIFEEWGSPQISFLPIGAYEPRDLLKHEHMNPGDAILAQEDLHSSFSTGIHYGTFQLSAESIDQPIKDLDRACIQLHIPANKFFISLQGLPWFFE